jgi:hypothetical protein
VKRGVPNECGGREWESLLELTCPVAPIVKESALQSLRVPPFLFSMKLLLRTILSFVKSLVSRWLLLSSNGAHDVETSRFLFFEWNDVYGTKSALRGSFPLVLWLLLSGWVFTPDNWFNFFICTYFLYVLIEPTSRSSCPMSKCACITMRFSCAASVLLDVRTRSILAAQENIMVTKVEGSLLVCV